jgi:hypothetical protein
MIFRNLFIFSILSFCFFSATAQSPNKKLPTIKLGGYVIYEKNGHGLIASIDNLGKLDFQEAKIACDSLQIDGFSDWRLPTREEFELIHPKLNLKKVGGGNIFQSSWYWTSTEVDKENAWTHNLQTGLQASYFKDFKCFVKAVRSF